MQDAVSAHLAQWALTLSFYLEDQAKYCVWLRGSFQHWNIVHWKVGGDIAAPSLHGC